MRKRFGVPVFYDSEALINAVTSNNDMESTWYEDDRMMYEKTWVNTENGAELRIEDVTQILSPTEQTRLHNFKEERYRVLEQPRYAPHAQLQDAFKDFEDALDYVEEEYEIDI